MEETKVDLPVAEPELATAKKKTSLVKTVEKPILATVNTPKMLCEHLLGEEHTHRHRMVFGVVFMVIGVGISKCFVEIHILHLLCDGIGYALHGMGTLPFVERIQQLLREARARDEQQAKE